MVKFSESIIAKLAKHLDVSTKEADEYAQKNLMGYVGWRKDWKKGYPPCFEIKDDDGYVYIFKNLPKPYN